ncbi:MAG: DMT family transporter [Rhodospirillales bacterium]
MTARLLGLPATPVAMAMWSFATLMEASMMGVLRYIGTALDRLQIVFMRCLFGMIFLTPLIMRSAGGLRIKHVKLHGARTILQFISMLLWFASLTLIPLAEVAALSFLAPLVATVGAVLILRESIGWRRGLAMIAGFTGVLILLRPGFTAINLGSLMVIGSAVLWGFALLIIKRLTQRETPMRMTAIVTIMLTPLTLVPALFVWQWPTTEQWLLMAVVGVSGSCSHMLMSTALKFADATAVLPMDFSRILWTSLIEFFFFAQEPTIFTFIGGIVIFAAATYVTLREAQLARQAPAAEVTAKLPID